jgi:hypothetical protein
MDNSITIVVEWENAEGVGQKAALDFLRRLVDGLLASKTAKSYSLRLLFVFDENVEEKQLREDLTSALTSVSGKITLEFLLTPGAPYYAKKGLVAYFVSTQFLVYADSDCAYVPGWLDVMIQPLLEGRTDLTFGDTVAATGETFTEKVSALAWFFPTENPNDTLRPKGVNRFFANNFGVRTSALLNCPPPRHTGSRSHGSLWMNAWDKSGLRREKVLAGIARHRQFDSFDALIERAWLFGFDKDVANALTNSSRLYRCMRAFAAFFELTAKFSRRWLAVGPSTLGFWGMLAAYPLGLAFQLTAVFSQFYHAVVGRRFEMSSDYTDLKSAARLLT